MVDELISRFFKLSRSSGCALLIVIAVVALLSACATLTERKQKARIADHAQILETQIVVRGKGPAKWHYFDFNVPKAGSATLTLSNGARTDAPSDERVKGAEITLNGEAVTTPKKFDQQVDILEVPVGDRLRVGGNRLGIRLCIAPEECAAPGKRIAVHIDAPADKVVLTPVLNPLVLGRNALRAQATVTGLGVPVRRSKVRFEVLDLGPVPKQLASTGRTGTTTAFLREFSTAGRGRLRASVAGTDPLLSYEIPIQVVKAPAIKLAHSLRRLSVEERDQARLAIVVDVLEGRQQGYHVTLEQLIEPDPKGVAFATDLPSGGIIGTEPQHFTINGKVTGIIAGTYTVTTTATITETGDKWSDTLTINVVDPSAPDPLVLGVPSANPAGIPPGAPSTVTFLALVDGTSTPPEVLFLDEVDAQGKPLSELFVDCDDPEATCLRDDGKDEDKHAGDLAYTGTLDISGSDEAEKYFRVRAEYFGKTVISGSVTFFVTPFRLKARPSKGPLVDDPKSESRFFANEVILKVRPGVLPDRVETIAAAGDGKVVGVIPSLRTYLVQITGDGTANGVLEAIAAMSAFDNEVERASPNHVAKPLAFPDTEPNDPGYCDSDTPCTCDEPPCQWHLPKVKAREAWQLAGGGDPLYGVAVIDLGVKCDHEDLADEDKCARDDTVDTDHGTWVAGIIAATADNGEHIAGVAWDTKLYAYDTISEYSIDEAINNEILGEANARIINISEGPLCPDPDTVLKDAVTSAIGSGRLVVTGSGNGCVNQALCPADYNTDLGLKDGLLVVGATNETDAPQYGTCNNAYKIDLYAPGIDIRSIGLNSTNRPTPTGTSMATAIVSGAAAVLWASDFVTPPGTTRARAVHERLIRTATPLPGVDNCQNLEGTGTTTCGRLNLSRAVATEGVVLVFDTSGSMAWRPDGTFPAPPEEQRLTFAKNAATPFLELLNNFRLPGTTFGIATFPAHPSTFPWPCTAEVVTPMTTLTESSKTAAVDTTIPGLTTEDNTPLLAGIQTGASMFGSEVNRAIILLSDGYHNCPYLVSEGDSEVSDLISHLQSESIRVFTIGYGRPTDTDDYLLSTLANETAPTGYTESQFYDVTDPSIDPATALQSAYKAILTDTLGLQSAMDPLGVISGGKKKTAAVNINEHDHRASFFLSWRTPRAGRLKLIVKASDGVELHAGDPGVHIHEGNTYGIISVGHGFLRRPGKVESTPWTLEIAANALSSRESEHYQCSVILDSALELRAGFDKTSYGTGETITLSARITEAGIPVAGLEDVTVYVRAPGEGQGNWLAINTVSAEELKKVHKVRGSEVLSLLLRKASYLADIRKLPYPRPKQPRALRLYDDGSHGDKIAKDGIYTNQFADTAKEGVYSFHFRTSGSTRGGNAFQRERFLQKFVSVKVELGFTQIDVVRLKAEWLKRFEIKLIPKDALGNYLGPGHRKAFKLEASRGELIGKIEDNLDGSYRQILEIPFKADEKDVELTLDIVGRVASLNLARLLAERLTGGFEYAAKLVCGLQKNPENMKLARGYYATSINIHNPGNSEVRFSKKLSHTFLPEEQKAGEVVRIAEDKLQPDEALSVDCRDIQREAFPKGFPTTYIEGFVIIQSPRSLDVTAVYTTRSMDREGRAASQSSIDVEPVPERQIGHD